MIECAENIARHEGYKKISITSGVGVRNYYKKYGYRLEGDYMTKVISKNINWLYISIITIMFIVFLFINVLICNIF